MNQTRRGGTPDASLGARNAAKDDYIAYYISIESEPPVSIEANKALVRRFFDEAINERKLEILDEILAPHFAGNKQEYTDQVSTRDDMKRGLAMVLGAFPDYHQTIH